MVAQKQAVYEVEVREEGRADIRSFFVDAYGESEAVAKVRAVIRREGNQNHHDVLRVVRKGK